MSYTPSATDTAEPLGSRPLGQADDEIRTIKLLLVRTLRIPEAGNVGDLPAAASRRNRLLAFADNSSALPAMSAFTLTQVQHAIDVTATFTSTTVTDIQSWATSAQTSATSAAASATASATSATSASASATSATNSASGAAFSAAGAADNATIAYQSEQSALAAAALALTRQTAAATSATAAASSATNASASATAAASSATAATTQATNAATSASAAAGSVATASAAATTATNASAAAAVASNSASSHATAASASATSAQTASTSAALSATSANSSATSAQDYASTASAMSTAATNSATAASNSATNAATSETNAAASATTATTQATNAAASATSASSSWLSIDTKYLGAKAADPTTNNQGGALTTGTTYWNTATNAMRVYSAGTWIEQAYAGGSSVWVNATVSGALTLSGGTANGVPYLNGSKVVTSGSSLTYDGKTLANSIANTSTAVSFLKLTNNSAVSNQSWHMNMGWAGNYDGYLTLGRASSPGSYDLAIRSDGHAALGSGLNINVNGTTVGLVSENNSNCFVKFGGTGQNTLYGATALHSWTISGTEYARLNTTGLGIGTSSPGAKLHVYGSFLSGQVASSYSSGYFEAAGTAKTATHNVAAFRTSDAVPSNIVFAHGSTGTNTSYWSISAAEQGIGTVPIALNPAGGNVLIGTSNTSFSDKLHVEGTTRLNGSVVQAPPATAVTLTTNGTFTVERTSNTQLTFKLRGTDGVTRSGTITLS